MSILNLTQHVATPEQIAAGVVDLPAEQRAILTRLLTFDELPEYHTIASRAQTIARLATECGGEYARVMIGGAPWFMSTLERALTGEGHVYMYAFSVRDSADGPDGRKVSVFRHAGFVIP